MGVTLAITFEPRDLAAILALTVSAVALFVSIWVHKRTRSMALYSDIDRLYLELLRLAIEHPNFADPEYTNEYPTKFDSEERARYELYAFIAWNICETIVDREDDKLTFQSWEPILALESTLHKKWFESESNRNRFKECFKKYMKQNKERLQDIANGRAKSA